MRRHRLRSKESSLLRRHSYFSAIHDLDQTKGLVASRFCGHEMSLLERGQLDAWMNVASARDVVYSVMGYGLASRVIPGRTETFYPIVIPLRGGGRLRSGNHEVSLRSGAAAVASASVPMQVELSGDGALLVVCVGRRALERYATDMLGEPLTMPLTFMPAMDVNGGRAARWRDEVLADIDDLDSPDSMILAHGEASRAAECKVITSLLLTQPHNYSEKLARADCRTGADSIVRTVEEYIEAYPDLPLTVSDLAAQVNYSVRALQEAFRSTGKPSPKRFLKERRMRLAREKLTVARPRTAATVSAIAASCGFTHFGRFARDYRNRYGEAPSETLRRC
ncbi:AraC family transcriptional regulator [Haloechinothrix salitolerans]|uniref:AraC family transcriptional regulator n=1 Tax=Haloechinothrix salitolerans TaxID=926830 RepID=A0ABW2BZI4_9PSEU